MSLDAAKKEAQHQQHQPQEIASFNRNGTSVPPGTVMKLRLNPSSDHKSDSYEDLQLDFSPLFFSSLEPYLPVSLLSVSREEKLRYMRDILLRYSPEGERFRAQRHREYREKIMINYQPCHKELYDINAANVFVPSFINAIQENTEQSFRSIMTEPVPGVFTFEIFKPEFCNLMLSEVDNFEKWVHVNDYKIMRPNTMNKFGAVLADFGLEAMLDSLMEDYVRPISKVFFHDVGGATLDSHHGFVVEYGIDRDVELAFHVDDSEVTLNVCLGNQFSGGELFLRGVRCDRHVNTETLPEEILDYSHVPGRAILHRGRHRHGARATVSGRRANLLLWCRSSVFRELRKYQKDFPSWCGQCQREKRERQRNSIAATKEELLKRGKKSAS